MDSLQSQKETLALNKHMDMSSIVTGRKVVYVVTDAVRWVYVIVYWEYLDISLLIQLFRKMEN